MIIAIDEQPLARFMPLNGSGQKKRIAGLNRGQIWMSDDFDAPLPDQFWLREELGQDENDPDELPLNPVTRGPND